jgi:hypothetical protein
MKDTRLNTLAQALAVLALAAGAASSAAGDAALNSFERMLAHQPSTHTPPTAAGAGADPLVEAMVVPLRGGVRQVPVRPADPVADSFARMLAHTPSTHVPPVPAGFGADPLVAAMVEPLRRPPTLGVAVAPRPGAARSAGRCLARGCPARR